MEGSTLTEPPLLIEEFNSTRHLDAVHSLVQDTITKSYSAAYPPLAVELFQGMYTLETIVKKSNDGLTVVATLGGAVVGTGTAGVNEISGVFVSTAHQGRGIGRLIMASLERYLKGTKQSSVSLSVSLPSVAFYKALGYGGFDEMSIDVGEGQSLEYWLATKSL